MTDLANRIAANVTVYPGRDEWLADSRSTAPDYVLGASAAYRMLTGAFGGIWAVYREARGLKEPDSLDDNAAVQAGLEHEPDALRAYTRLTGIETALGDVYHRIGHDWLHVSPDAWGVDQDRLGLVECKVPMPGQFMFWAADGYQARLGDLATPERYETQALIQATAAEAAGLPVEWVDVFGWWGPHMTRRIRYTFTREEKQEAWIKLAKLRKVHLLDGVEPEIDDSRDCSQHIVEGRNWIAEARENATPEWEQRLREYAAACADFKAAEKHKKRLANEIKKDWPDGIKTLVIPSDAGERDGTATLGKNRITLTRIDP